jgi:hypothetical protein
MMRQVTSLPDLFFIRYIILIKFPIFYCASIFRAFVCNLCLVHNAILVFRDGFGILNENPESEQVFIEVCQQLLFCRCQQLPSVCEYIIILSGTTFAQWRAPSGPDSILKVRWMVSGMLFCHQNEKSWHTPSQTKEQLYPCQRVLLSKPRRYSPNFTFSWSRLTASRLSSIS